MNLTNNAILFANERSLRPLSFSVPHALIEFLGIPIIVHNIKWLMNVGVSQLTIIVNPDEYNVISQIINQTFNAAAIVITYKTDFENISINHDLYIVIDCDSVKFAATDTQCTVDIIQNRIRSQITINDTIQLSVNDFDSYTCSIFTIMNKMSSTSIHPTTVHVFSSVNVTIGEHCIIKCPLNYKTVIGSHVSIGDAVIGSGVVIGDNVTINNGVYLSDCIIMSGTTIHENAYITRSIIGGHSRIKKWAHITDSVLADDVEIAQGIIVKDTIVLPHKSIVSDLLGITESKKIVM